jgi:hypothetical protein
MVNQIDANDTCHFLPSIGDLELLEVLLAAEDSTYPWNPADDTTEDYFHQLEQQVGPQNLEELTSGEANFFLHLDMIWDQIPNYDQEIPNKQSLVNFLHEILDQAFAQFVPSVWLTTIAQTAAKVSTLEQLAGERLVECIQDLFPSWNIDDLLVVTRPLAIMRDMKPQDLTLSIIHRLEQQEWTDLTEVEQARSICLIADFALKQLDSFHSAGNQTAGEE